MTIFRKNYFKINLENCVIVSITKYRLQRQSLLNLRCVAEWLPLMEKGIPG